MGALLALMVDAWVVPMALNLNSATPSHTEPTRGIHPLGFRGTETTPASALQPGSGCAECHQKQIQQRGVPVMAVPAGRDET